MTAKEFLKQKGYYVGSLMLSKTKGNGLVSIEQAMQEYADQQLILHGVVSTCCDETRKVNQFLKRPSKYCMTCSKELK